MTARSRRLLGGGPSGFRQRPAEFIQSRLVAAPYKQTTSETTVYLRMHRMFGDYKSISALASAPVTAIFGAAINTDQTDDNRQSGRS